MSNTPLVSAIIIFLHEERYLREAIESVCSQSYSNWELLLVDDGSTDAALKLHVCMPNNTPKKYVILNILDIRIEV